MMGNVWIAHPYRGIYTVLADEIRNKKTTQRLYGIDRSGKKQLKNMIYGLGSKIVVADDQNLYEINAANFSLTQYTFSEDLISVRDGVKYIIEDDYKNIWYGTGRENGLLVPEKKFEPDYKKFILKGLSGKLTDGHESVLTIDKENVIFPTDKGVLLFNPSSYMNDTSSVQLLLTKVILRNDRDSLLHQGSMNTTSDQLIFKLPNGNNDILFQFSVKGYPDKEAVEYAQFLKGSDKNWTDWSGKSSFNFNKLAPGKYELSVKARNQSGIESNVITVQIIVAYPWYQSIQAYILYFLLFVGMVLWIIKRQKIKHESEKKKIEEKNLLREKEHLINAELNKEEIIKLQNEKLEAELKYKNQELTSFTYHLVTKNELITEIKKAISKLEPKFEINKELKKEFKNIIHLTEQNDDIDADWENFIQSFDQVHSDFFKRLNEGYKALSPNDYKMCTYLRMNLTSKEIAALMNISIRSVETNRYRLRKKLGLHQDENLTQFLLKY
jgi:DNA-binding CsgD family transcriptional regulator